MTSITMTSILATFAWSCFQPPSENPDRHATIHNLTDHPAELWADARYLGQVPAQASSRAVVTNRELRTANEQTSRGVSITICSRSDDSIAINSLVIPTTSHQSIDVVWGGVDRPEDSIVADIDASRAATLDDLAAQRWTSLAGLQLGQPSRFSDTLIGRRHHDLAVVGQVLSATSGGTSLVSTSFGTLLRRIPKGSFSTGTSYFGARGSVSLTRDYYMSVTEVTRGQLAFLNGQPTPSSADIDLPASGITWQEATDACELMGGIGTWIFRLPTEAQWEFACQSGKLRRFSPDSVTPHQAMWCSTNSGGRMHRVATRLPNDFGIFDMHGNVREWCRDWWSPKPPNGPDPTGPQSGTERVRRGGAYDTPMEWCGTGFRDAGIPDLAQSWQGFRVVLELAQK